MLYFTIYNFANQTGCNGNDSCCTHSIPCNEGEGDCDSDLDCKGGLICGHNNCNPSDNPQEGGSQDVNDCCMVPKDGRVA